MPQKTTRMLEFLHFGQQSNDFNVTNLGNAGIGTINPTEKMKIKKLFQYLHID